MKKKLNARPETTAGQPAASGPAPVAASGGSSMISAIARDVLVRPERDQPDARRRTSSSTNAARLAPRRCSSAIASRPGGAGLRSRLQPIQRQVELEHVHAGARPARRASATACARGPGRAPPADRARVPCATRSTCTSAPRREMSGSSPEADAVTRSTGTEPAAMPVGRRDGRDAFLDRCRQVGGVRPEVRGGGAARRCSRRRRAGAEVLRAGEGLAEEARADDSAVAHDQAAVGPVLERDLGDAQTASGKTPPMSTVSTSSETMDLTDVANHVSTPRRRGGYR